MCHNSLKEIQREHLSEILIKLCAHITSRPNKAALIVINKNNNENVNFQCLVNKNVPIVSHEWILGKELRYIN